MTDLCSICLLYSVGDLQKFLEERDELFFEQVDSDVPIDGANCFYDSETGLREYYSFNQENCIKHTKMMLDIITGLEVLYDEKIIHRDLKPANILYDSNGTFKIADFGESRIVSDGSMSSRRGNIEYRPPEQFGSHYDSSADIYAIGQIFFEIMYPCRNDKERSKLLSRLKDYKKSDSERIPETKNNLFNSVIHKILWMVSQEPEDRPPVNDMLRFCGRLYEIVIEE